MGVYERTQKVLVIASDYYFGFVGGVDCFVSRFCDRAVYLHVVLNLNKFDRSYQKIGHSCRMDVNLRNPVSQINWVFDYIVLEGMSLFIDYSKDALKK
jgi:hypothetical protein